MKDGSKPERAVDFGTGVVLATPVHFAAGGATTPAPTMAEAHESVVGLASTRALQPTRTITRPRA